jgi:glycosyltransferase involved in cell wall biosynthesis
MKILMFGWEYPPVKSGGLGTACYGLTKAMAKLGAEITMVVPKAVKSEFSTHLNLIDGQNIKVNSAKLRYFEIDSLLSPYLTEDIYKEKFKDYHQASLEESEEQEITPIYGRNLFEEVARFAFRAGLIATLDNYDLIVCHDWMTVDAALHAQAMIHKPICLHMHATEFDRTGGHPNQLIYDIELRGMQRANLIIANSNFTKQNCVNHFGIDPQKIIPVHLAVEQEDYKMDESRFQRRTKNVLFIARLTVQKGPEYFVRAAKIAADFDPELRFIMAGDGDSFGRMMHLAADLGIADKIFFTGFLNEKQAQEIFRMADLFVMTSVAEPFGLTVLEAIRSGVPCIIPNNCGTAEILNHVIKIDFWDVNELANNIVSVMRYPVLHQELRDNSYRESENITWENTARRTMEVYNRLVPKGELAYA